MEWLPNPVLDPKTGVFLELSDVKFEPNCERGLALVGSILKEVPPKGFYFRA
ncbi:hypothetical protein QCA50_015645 [Cerrena zonata]|uniref:Uncharacterized protein n=1 Tax=Cerrena zonata TaxID=2478898 RepID=A0AAW0FUP9_9APHY